MTTSESDSLPLTARTSHSKQESQPSIEDVESRLAVFQERLLQYGKDMFGEDFVLNALPIAGGTEILEQESLRPSTGTTTKPKSRSNRTDKKRDNAKTVLQRFLNDREELMRLRVIAQVAQERIAEKIGGAESRVKQLQTLLLESERRRKADVQGSQAFLTELRKKLASVERTQRRLLALVTRPDDEVLDRVLERQARREAIEVGVSPRELALVDNDDAHGNLEDTLTQLSKELEEIEKSMAMFTRA